MKTPATSWYLGNPCGRWHRRWRSIFSQAIKNLEKRFPFGSQRTGSFTFTGVQTQQEHNGDITINQKDYVNDIPPINITRDRRNNPDSPINKDELQSLRRLIGSLQYAATNTRPAVRACCKPRLPVLP